jgi:hypothetical protein
MYVGTVKTEAPYIAVKREEAKRLLGTKWLLHPANKVQRLTPFRPIPVQLNLAYDK